MKQLFRAVLESTKLARPRNLSSSPAAIAEFFRATSRMKNLGRIFLSVGRLKLTFPSLVVG